MRKLILRILVVQFFLLLTPAHIRAQEQSDMFKQKKERKRLWRKWRKDKGSYNPYLHKKAKDRPSAKLARNNKRDQRRAKKLFKKQLKAGKKNTSD